MKINAIITKAVCAAALFATASCNSLIYDYEGDCDPHYKARFVFDMNLHWADAFPHEVNAVTPLPHRPGHRRHRMAEK